MELFQSLQVLKMENNLALIAIYITIDLLCFFGSVEKAVCNWFYFLIDQVKYFIMFWNGTIIVSQNRVLAFTEIIVL